MSALIRFGESLFPHLLDAAWKATALMAIVFALAKVLGRRRQVARYWLWLYCPAGILILPATSFVARGQRIALLPAKELPAALDRGPSSAETGLVAIDRSPTGEAADDAVPQEAAGTVLPAEKFSTESTAGDATASETAAAGSKSGAPSAARRPATTMAAATISRLRWRGWISLGWIGGCTLLLMRLLFAAVSVTRLRRSSSPVVDSTLLKLFGETKKAAGFGMRAELRVGKSIPSPACVGIFRPTLLLPESLVQEMPLEQLRPILLHELAHIRWGDYAVNVVQRLAEAVFFFHPFVWFASRGLRALREEICDNWVLDHHLNGALYAKALTELAGRSLCPRAGRVATLGLFSHCALIRRRIERILAPGKRPASTLRLKTAAVLLSISLVTVGFLSLTSFSARAVQRRDETAAEKPEAASLRVVEGKDLNKMPFMKTLARYSRYELPSKPAAEEAAPAARKFGKKAVVAADGSGDTRSIQEAVDGVDEGGTASIKPGTYRERVTISKPLSIEGAGRDKTRIEATSQGQGVRWVSVSIESCVDVSFKGLTIASGTRLGEQSGLVLMDVRDAAVHVEECNLLSAQYGMTISGNSNARIEKCLVAGIWGTGIAIGRDASATVNNCEVRNCYHRCITVQSNGDVRIENNLISGSAWHGIRYDNCSPTIVGNVLNNHARCSIYASGSGEPKIINNLFLRNDMSGVSTWYRTNPVIRNNTFVENKRGGLEMDVTTRPVVENNIFFANETAASRFYTSSSRRFADSSLPPELSHNLLWKNKSETPPPPRAAAERVVELRSQLEQLQKELADLRSKYTDEHPQVVGKRKQIEALNSVLQRAETAAAYKPPELSFSEAALRVDPLFVDAAADNYNLGPDSPARGAGKDGADIGATLSISVEPQYPITPEEKLIIPDSESRDWRLWKKGVVAPPRGVAGRIAAPAPATRVRREVVIDVTKEGKFLVGKAEKSIEEVGEMLQGVAKVRPDVRITVRGHEDAPFRSMARVLDACRKANTSNVSFEVLKGKPEAKGRLFYVEGEVNKPGQFSLLGERKMTLLRAIAMAGGFSRLANKSRVVLITRDDAGKQKRTVVDVSEIFKKPELDPFVKANDIVHVPESWL